MSHLSTLITRVKRCEFAGCPEAQDCGAGEYLVQALREKLINIVEYMTYSHDYDRGEATEAVALLRRHGMAELVGNPGAISGVLNETVV